jgi:Suppressor of fused protein (SUFU)
VGEKHWVDVMRWPGRPVLGYDTYSTLSLHKAPNVLDDADVRVEILGVAPSSAIEFVNLLSTAAFFVIKDHWLCSPGGVFPDLLATYYPGLSRRLRHLLFVEPLPHEQLSRVDVGMDLDVHWLLAIPISQGERRFLNEHGYDQLEALFVTHDLPYFDLDREPVA